VPVGRRDGTLIQGRFPVQFGVGGFIGDSVVPRVAHEERSGSRVGVSSFIISRNNQRHCLGYIDSEDRRVHAGFYFMGTLLIVRRFLGNCHA
jgi:hypothetical protein